MRCCQMVMGPAGVGKSTYCKAIQDYAATSRRTIHVVNLDPAAEAFEYDVAFDVRDLITLADVMEELELGPNGGLVYCMEYLLDNVDWLKDELDNYDDDEYIVFDCPGQVELYSYEYNVFDCPGQVELYSHIPVMKRLLEHFRYWGYTVCGVYALDATFMGDPAKFISGTLLSLSAMVQLELPHINVLTKCDLADMEEVEKFLDLDSAALASMHELATRSSRQRLGGEQGGQGAVGGAAASDAARQEGSHIAAPASSSAQQRALPRLERLTAAIAGIIDEFSMVGFIPMDISDDQSVALVLQHADHITQYGEGLEPKDPDDEAPDDDSMAQEFYGGLG
ncbi:GPN-loop GTPase [Tribonema minus]|uniref:GPN-loop GTPase 3 n=1 Tax=Tribonema minus TaxID=303371 RepID=A0A835YPS9_9STRA|nr:GPN-loop GTPase [Tribonema minus]